jgi:hypothetical protein
MGIEPGGIRENRLIAFFGNILVFIWIICLVINLG